MSLSPLKQTHLLKYLNEEWRFELEHEIRVLITNTLLHPLNVLTRLSSRLDVYNSQSYPKPLMVAPSSLTQMGPIPSHYILGNPGVTPMIPSHCMKMQCDGMGHAWVMQSDGMVHVWVMQSNGMGHQEYRMGDHILGNPGLPHSVTLHENAVWRNESRLGYAVWRNGSRLGYRGCGRPCDTYSPCTSSI